MKKDRLSAFLDKYVAGGPTTAKAKEMLRDGSVHGHPLTDKQKRYFGWIAGGKKQKGGSLPLAQDGTEALFQKYYGQVDRSDVDPAGFDYYMYRNPEFKTLSSADRLALIKRMKDFLQYESGPRATQAEDVDTNTVFPDTPEQVDRRIRRNPELQTNKDLTPKKPFGHGSYEYEDYKTGGRLDTYQGEQSQTGFIGPPEETKSAVVRQIGVDAEGDPIQRPTTDYYLPTIDITAEKEDTYNNYMADKYRDAGLGEALFMAPLDYVFGYPQAAMTKLLSGKYQLPSEAMGIENPYGAIATDILLDPANLVGAGVLTKDAALARLAASKESGLLSNAYKLNPWRFKPNPEAYYRMLGKEGMADALESGVIRSNPKGSWKDIEPYFNKGNVLDEAYEKKYRGTYDVFHGYDGPHMVEVKNEKLFKPIDYENWKNKPKITQSIEPININDVDLKFYKQDWLRGYKEVPIELPGSPNASYVVQRAGFPNPLAVVDAVVPRLPHPVRIPLLGAAPEGLGPFTGSPLNFLPGYGETLGVKGRAYRKFGNTMGHVIDTKTLSPKGGSSFRMGRDQIVNEGNWAALNRPDEMYPGTFAAEFDFRNPGANLGYVSPSNRNGVLIIDAKGNSLPDIPITDEGLQFYRRLPFSNRYIPINKEKLLNDEFQLATQGGYLQSLAEKYGYGLGYAGLFGAMGYPDAVEKYNSYTIDPIVNFTEEQLKELKLDNKKKGGSLPMAQKGLIVNDPNDPRLRAYQDSSYLYNTYTLPLIEAKPDSWNTQEDIDKLKDLLFGPSIGYSVSIGSSQAGDARIAPGGWKDIVKDLKSAYGSLGKKARKINPNILPRNWVAMDSDMLADFDKPRVKVVYQPRPKLDMVPAQIRELKQIPTSYDDIQPVARPVASAPEFVNFTAAGQPMVDVRTGETTEVPMGYRIVTDEKGIRRLSEKEKNYRLNKKQKGGRLDTYQGTQNSSQVVSGRPTMQGVLRVAEEQKKKQDAVDAASSKAKTVVTKDEKGETKIVANPNYGKKPEQIKAERDAQITYQNRVEHLAENPQDWNLQRDYLGMGINEPAVEYVPVESVLLPASLPFRSTSLLGKTAIGTAEMVNPFSGFGINPGKVKDAALAKLAASKESGLLSNAWRLNPIPKLPSWQIKELPGLHLKSTMEGQAISKIVESKTGLVNVDQALGIIAKESGGKEKVDLIRQAFGDNIPKKMDYNEFRKVVQDQLIPLERQFSTKNSNYGLGKIGYGKTKPGTWDLENPNEILENQTLILGNKNKFGIGSAAHNNPPETLGHIHFLRNAETPDVLTVTQIQSDAFQGTHRAIPKSKEAAEFSYRKGLEHQENLKNIYKNAKPKMESGLDLDGNPYWYELPDGTVIHKDAYFEGIHGQQKLNDLQKAEIENFTQKQLLDKNHQERYLQELVNYAGERGDINKLRLPTSETAAKVQGYSKNTATGMDEMGLPTDLGYSSEHQTILKKYSEQPKTIKKLFGVEPKVVTDSKGNTWYEFDIPEKFKQGKGEIKAFSMGGIITPPAAIIGAGAMEEKRKGGSLTDKQKEYFGWVFE